MVSFCVGLLKVMTSSVEMDHGEVVIGTWSWVREWWIHEVIRADEHDP
jgi:hypothetical protein